MYSVLLLDEGNDGLAENIGRALLLNGGFEVHCLTEWAGRLRLHRAETVEADLSSGPAVLKAVEAYAVTKKVDVVLPIQESMIARTASVADELRSLAAVAAIPSSDQLDVVHDKWLCRQLFIGAGIDVPQAWSLADFRAVRADLTAFGGSLLLKPTQGKGGRGIQRYPSGSAVVAAIETGQVDLDPDPALWMVEEYVNGEDAGVGLLAQDGEVIGAFSRRIVVRQGTPFRSAGVVLDFEPNEALLELGHAFTTAATWSGPADVDCLLAADGRVLALEVNPRYWQTVLGPVGLGSNYPVVHCLLALGKDVPTMPPPKGRWLNIDSLLQDWRNLRSLAPNVHAVLPASGLRLAMVDPRYEIDLFRVHARRQVTTSIRRGRTRRR